HSRIGRTPSGTSLERAYPRPGRLRAQSAGTLERAPSRIGTKEMEAATAPQSTDIDQLCINTIRTLAIDAVQKANSGHPGTPMALAPIVYALWRWFLRYDPDDPPWPNRDRFVLSAGHASMLLYAILHLSGVRRVEAGK